MNNIFAPNCGLTANFLIIYIYTYIITRVRWKPTKTDTFVVRIHRDGLLVHFYDPFNIERWPTIPEGRSCLLASGSLLHPRYFLICACFLHECNVTIAFCSRFASILNVPWKMKHYTSCRTLWRKREDEKISFFFFLLSPIMIISSGSKKFDQSSSDSRSRLVKRNRNRLCFLSQPPSKDASNDTEESDKNNEMG